MKRWLKKWLKHLAWKKERQNQCVIDFRGLEVEGVDALKRAQESPVAILAPIENCRSLHDAAFSFGANCFDPYFMTANQIIKTATSLIKEAGCQNILKKFSQLVRLNCWMCITKGFSISLLCAVSCLGEAR